jgi:hypothetical protein
MHIDIEESNTMIDFVAIKISNLPRTARLEVDKYLFLQESVPMIPLGPAIADVNIDILPAHSGQVFIKGMFFLPFLTGPQNNVLTTKRVGFRAALAERVQ